MPVVKNHRPPSLAKPQAVTPDPVAQAALAAPPGQGPRGGVLAFLPFFVILCIVVAALVWFFLPFPGSPQKPPGPPPPQGQGLPKDAGLSKEERAPLARHDGWGRAAWRRRSEVPPSQRPARHRRNRTSATYRSVAAAAAHCRFPGVRRR